MAINSVQHQYLCNNYVSCTRFVLVVRPGDIVGGSCFVSITDNCTAGNDGVGLSNDSKLLLLI